ncbi:MAG: hypothetical protein QHD01_01080 [Bradyrhizobium sp.]|nr:hypothetical protein [Bradyrhizobium sp.]
MDQALLNRAEIELEHADQSLRQLSDTKQVDEVAYHWANFLGAFDRIFNRIGAAAGGNGNAWFGRVEQFRKADPLLSYLMHARNAQEHGLLAVAEERSGFINLIGAEQMEIADPKAGIRVTFDIQDPHLALVDVKDRGVLYAVPTSFRGRPISAAHPLSIGLLGLSYIEEVLVEARSM